MVIAIGSHAPDFELEDDSGAKVRLSAFRGERNVVVFFYPKDHTPICTKESCAFRDDHASFAELGAVILGISGDDRGSHQRFKRELALPFPLLSDPGHRVAAQYGALSMFGLMPGRLTVVIDREGIVRHAFSASFKARAHVDEAKRALEKL